MRIVVLLKMVPDVVEELEVSPDGRSLNPDVLRMIVNERDNHALEEALLLKERHGGTVSVVAPDAPEVDEMLYTAVAKGAERAVKVAAPEYCSSRAAAACLAEVLPTVRGLLPADLILTGCQAIDDLDGMLAPLLAQALGWPYVGLVTDFALSPEGSSAIVTREFASGIRAEYEVPLPAVLGVQAAEKPPRYVPVAKVRAAMKARPLEEAPAAMMADGGLPLVEVGRLAQPQAAGHAAMLEGSSEEVADKINEILAKCGVA
jgi:electron transfer flavoprotein beta subunit